MTIALRSSFCRWTRTVRDEASRSHWYSASEPMTPRLRVTSGTFVSPGSLRTALTLSLPLRYSMTSTFWPSPETSCKPASGP